MVKAGRSPAGSYTALVNATVTRATYVLVVLALFGVVPAGVGLVISSLGWLPLSLSAAAVGPLWGLSFLRTLLPARRRANDAALRRLSSNVDAVATSAGVRPPWVAVSRVAVGASISWCNDQPRLTFPELWMQRLDDVELRTYLAHELAHEVQPAYRAEVRFNNVTSLVGGAMVGLCFVIFEALLRGTLQQWMLILYCALPVALTLILMLRPLFLRSELAGLEVAADDQAVRWGASPSALADVLDRLETREMEVPLPPDRWLLTRMLLLLRPRTVRMRVLRLRHAPAPVGEGR